MNGEGTLEQEPNLDEWRDVLKPPTGDLQSPVAKVRFGFVPQSVLNFENEDRWQLPIDRALMARVGIKRSWDRDWDKAEKEGHFVAKGNKVFIASQFNSGLARFLVRYYTDPGATILDPFAGWGTRAYVSMLCGRHYVGYDVAKEAVDAVNAALARAKQATLDGQPPGSAIVYLGDGIKVEGILDAFADAILTCPPYADSEVYDDCPPEVGYQLSRLGRGYFEMFMKRGFKRWWQVLKPGGLMIMVVGDWREDGEVYPFGYLCQDWAFEAGFKLHDLAIHKLRSMTVAGIGPYLASKFVAKVHETILVFKKVA